MNQSGRAQVDADCPECTLALGRMEVTEVTLVTLVFFVLHSHESIVNVHDAQME